MRLLNGENIRWLCTQRIKHHLNNIEETDIEKEWENLQDILKSKTDGRLGKIKRQNRRKYLKMWDNQKKIIEEKSYKKWLISKTPEDRIKYKKQAAIAKREERRRQTASWDRFGTDVEHKHTGPNQKSTKF
jgi:hypothetical protein